jgi:hypothetical protein
MKNITLIIALTGFILFLTSCGSTSNLSKYNLDSKTFYFEEYVTTPETTVRIYTGDEHHRRSESIFTDLVELAKSVGTSIITAETENKIQDAVSNEEVAKTVSKSMENTLVKYLKIKSTRMLDDGSEFIVSTTLEDCSLISTQNGVYLQARANVQIVDRASGGIVWENNETRSTQLRYSENETTKIKSLSGFVQLAELASLSKEEIANSIFNATKEIGREMGETFREDFYESRR